MGWLVFVLVLCVLFSTPGCVWGKLCCDQGCKHPVSYGRTVQRHITRDEGFLSYPASAIVTVFSKDVHTTAEGEYWEAEIQGKRGLILNSALKELTHKCEPSIVQLQEEAAEEPLVPDGGAPATPTDHTHMDTPTPMGQTQSSTSTPSDDQPRPGTPLTPEDQSQDSSPPPPSDQQREMPQTEQGVPPVEPHNIQYQEPSGRQESVEQREREREVPQREEGEQMPPIDRFQDPTGSREPLTREPLREETKQISPDISDEPEEVKPVEENNRVEFQTVSLNIHPTQIHPVLADEHLSFAGNLEDQYKAQTSDDSRPQETPLAESLPPQQHQQKHERYLNDGGQNGESQEQAKEEEPFDKQYRVKDVYIHDELGEDELYAEVTPEPPSEQTKEMFESQEPPPSRVDEPNVADSVPLNLDTFSSETEKPEPVTDPAHKVEMFEESPHVVEPTPATFERHIPEPSFEEPPLTQDPSTFEPARTPESGHSTFDTTATTTSDTPVEAIETQESNKKSEQDQWQAEDKRSEDDQHEELGDDDDDGDYDDEEDDDEGYEDEDENGDDEDPYDDGRLETREEDGPEIVPPNQNERRFNRRFEELQQLHREQQELLRQQELLHQQQGKKSEQQEDESSQQKQQDQQFDQEREDDQQRQDDLQRQYDHQRQKEQQEHFISQQQQQQDKEPNQQQNPPDDILYSETPPTMKEAPPIPQGGPIPPISRPSDTNTQFEHQTAATKTTAPPCNCTEVITPTCECPDIGRPPCPKLSIDNYVPLPGSESGVMSLVEQYRAYVREMVLATLPQSIAEWIVENRPMLGVVCVGVAFLSLSIPLLLLVCISCGGQGAKKQVAIEKASRVRLEGERVKLETERNGLDQRLRESKEACQGLEDDLKLLRGERAQLEQANKQLQIDNQKVTESLTSSQQELTQYQVYSEQLNTQLATVNQELEETAQQRDEGIQTGREMSQCLTDLQNRVDGLEAQSEQLEQDKFRTQGALDTLQNEHDEATSELSELRTKCSNLDSELERMSSDLVSTNATLGEKESELVHLRECLSQLTDQVAESTVDGEEEGNEAQLAKIKAMLDTSKAQQELQRTMAERDNHLTHILEKTSQLEQQIADNEALREQLSQLEAKEKGTAQELRELQIKMRGVTEYFQEKESGLHRKIELGEINQEKFKSLESEAQEKAAASELEREREKEELKELRKQMADIEKSFISQLKSNEERAEDALVQLRRTEQDLRLANREVTTLKRRLAEAETAAAHPPPMVRPIPRQHPYPPQPQRTRPPSTGPLGQPPQGPSPQPPRPLSAPRLEPRTSSPANSESMTGVPPQDRAAQSMLNSSLPMRGPRGQSDLQSRSHSFRGPESRALHPAGAPPMRGPSPRHMSREQQVPSVPLPKLVEQPPRPYGVTPPPTEASSSQYRHPYDRPQAPHNGPPMSHDRGYPLPPPGDYRPPDGPRRPYPPTRPPYGAPPPRGPPRVPYRPPGPPMGPRPPRPGYPPQSMSGPPQRPRAPTQQQPGAGRPPAHMGGPPQTSQANKQPQAGSDFAV